MPEPAMEENLFSELSSFRRALHRQPELSGMEYQTAGLVQEFIARFEPNELLTKVGGTGLVAIFEGESPGPFIGIRSELDALPIRELSELEYRSENEGKGHLCGHDGHMTMVAGLAALCRQVPLKRGKVALIFQPAEENGKGAMAMLQDDRFRNLNLDRIIALHNLPGYPMGKIVCRKGSFNAASVGMKIKMEGMTSHAAEPEKGKNPAKVLVQLMDKIIGLSLDNYRDKNLQLVTPIFASLGDEAFGTSPGEASCGFTLRTFDESALKDLQFKAFSIYESCLKNSGFKHSMEWIEYFRPIINQDRDVEFLRAISAEQGLAFETPDLPFRWCEDFSFFDQVAPTFYFGIGSGLNQPALHNPDFDFPDELIPIGTRLFFELINSWPDA